MIRKKHATCLIIYLVFGLAITFIGLPILALFLHVSFQGFVTSFSTAMVMDALKLSLLTSLTSLCIIVLFGTPIAYVNARRRYFGKNMIEALITLPIVLPPAVAGVALLMAFGRRGLVGQYFSLWGFDIAFTTIAVVLAQIFVSAPFYIRQATTSFEDVNHEYEHVARTLGAPPLDTFFRITAPIALNGLLSGAILSWARALGEFGATVLFAGNFEGTTQTMPLAIYSALQGNLNDAIYLSIVLVLISFAVIAAIRLLGQKKTETGTTA